nr:immunoglobulin heavy chain junction region [Mus musculus]
CTILPYW